jgi:hypothetical protein
LLNFIKDKKVGTFTYRIEKSGPTKYFLEIRNEKLIGRDDVYSYFYEIPYLDLLYKLKNQNVNILLINYVIKNFSYEYLLNKMDTTPTFISIFRSYLINESNEEIKNFLYALDRLDNDKDLKFYTIEDHNRLKFISPNEMNFLLKDLNLRIFMECKSVEKELEIQFDGSSFRDMCLKKFTDEQITKQYDEIRNLVIDEKYEKSYNKYIEKNPALYVPNIINQSGKNLLAYLCENRFDGIYGNRSIPKRTIKYDNSTKWGRIFQMSQRWIEDSKRLNPDKYNTWKAHANLRKHVFNFVTDEIFVLDMSKAVIKYSYNVDYHYPRLLSIYIEPHRKEFNNEEDDIYININMPIVKNISLMPNLNSGSKYFITTELQNFSDEFYMRNCGYVIPILNEYLIPCLISKELFEKFNINGSLLFSAAEILGLINQKLDFLKELEESAIRQKYIDDHILKDNYHHRSTYLRDIRNINEANKQIFESFYFEKLQFYFIYKLCHFYEKDVNFVPQKYPLLTSDTIEQENEELGRRTELIVFWFLQKSIDGKKWINNYDDIDDDENIDDDISVENDTDILDCPIEYIPECNITWNNESGESFKPYDFSVEMNGVEYRIEVKSTRGAEDNLFYLSIKELEELVNDPDHYLLLRLSFIKEGYRYFGIHFNEEFYGRFYKIKPETYKLVKNNLKKWKEYYKEKSVRFTIDMFELVQNNFDEVSLPDFLFEPTVYDPKYWKVFDSFINNTFLYQPELVKIFELFSESHEITKLQKEFIKIKEDYKFKKNLDNLRFLSDLNVRDNSELYYNYLNQLLDDQRKRLELKNIPDPDDLPF